MSKVLGTNVKIKVEAPDSGPLDISSLKISREVGVVLAIGKDVTLPLKVGDKVAFKSWAVDIVDNNGETLYYIDEKTGGLKEIL